VGEAGDVRFEACVTTEGRGKVAVNLPGEGSNGYEVEGPGRRRAGAVVVGSIMVDVGTGATAFAGEGLHVMTSTALGSRYTIPLPSLVYSPTVRMVVENGRRPETGCCCRVKE